MQTIKTGKQKQFAYKKEYGRLNKAMKENFYLESIAIEYAIIEDRLVAFLHHAGIVSRTDENLRVNRAVYPYLRCLLEKNDNYTIKIKDISVKISLICKLLTLTKERALQIEECIAAKGKKKIAKKGYMLDLVNTISETIEKELVFDIFFELESWRKNRNQLIHALLNKTVESSEDAKKDCAEKGIILSRNIDNCLVKPFKVNNKLREKFNIQ